MKLTQVLASIKYLIPYLQYMVDTTVHTDQDNTYAAGKKQSFRGNLSKAAINIGVLNPEPSDMEIGDVFMTPAGEMKYYNGEASQIILNNYTPQALYNKFIDVSDNILEDLFGTIGYVLKFDGYKYLGTPLVSADISDLPSKVGNGGKYLRVKADESGFEFVTL